MLIYGILPRSRIIKLDNDNTNFKFSNLIESHLLNEYTIEEHVKDFLTYNKEDGNFYWKQSTNASIHIGTKAGTIVGTLPDGGYITISIFGKHIKAHKLAWFYEYGYIPLNEIDHINHNRLDNRINNLRETTQNSKNKSLYKNNTTGFSGVYKKGNKFAAQINGKKTFKYLGSFSTAKEAYNAKQIAEQAYNYHKNHGLMPNDYPI